MLLETCKARKLVANFDYTVSGDISLACKLVVDDWIQNACSLVRFEEEPVVPIIDYRHVFITSRFFGCELDVSKYPGLQNFVSASK